MHAQLSLAIETERKEQGELIDNLVRISSSIVTVLVEQLLCHFFLPAVLCGAGIQICAAPCPHAASCNAPITAREPPNALTHRAPFHLQEDTMERARLVMRSAMSRMNVAYKQAQSNHFLFLILFAVFLFLGLYILSKFYRLGRHIFG